MRQNEYRAKRDFAKTPEPRPGRGRASRKPIFVVQQHHATRLHYDFRLEAEGVLKSWAVPKEPTLDPSLKRLAVRVGDHPLGYAGFAGDIPEGQYGAGDVEIWDHGTYATVPADRPLTKGLDAGRVEFVLQGGKLRGEFALVRTAWRRGSKENWLLIKKRDKFAESTDAPVGKTPRATSRKPTTRPVVAGAGDALASGVPLSNLDKVMFPDNGITKGEVIGYYRKIAPRLLPFLKDRPVTLERLPDGLGEGKPHFWQKNTPATYPDWVPRLELPSEQGKPVLYALVNDLDTLLYLVNQGSLTLHVWFSRVQNLDRPDFVLFDLDRGPASFADVVRVAQGLHQRLDASDLAAFVKTSGKTGLHILVPFTNAGGYDAAREWALGVARQTAAEMPDTATSEIRKAHRGNRVYIDVMQNARGHHAVPPYVVRAVPGAAVSTPLNWRELTPALDPGAFTIKTIFRRLSRQKADPLAGLLAAGRAKPAGVS
jgi:bifunctional non-homologous end joining protein LigD